MGTGGEQERPNERVLKSNWQPACEWKSFKTKRGALGVASDGSAVMMKTWIPITIMPKDGWLVGWLRG